MQEPKEAIAIDVEALRAGFTHVCFERTGASGETLFYYLSYQPSLFDGWAVVRIYGVARRRQKRLPLVPYASLDEAWPFIKAVIQRRLREGCVIVDPAPL